MTSVASAPASHAEVPVHAADVVVAGAGNAALVAALAARERGARVLVLEAAPKEYATNEITGGFFYHNYPAGAGLVRGAVFGRIAGEAAARYAAECKDEAERRG